MSQPPLSIRRSIRDDFTSPDSDLQQKFTSLKETIGLPIDCYIDWPILWSECEANFVGDKIATFVPYVIGTISGFCNVLESKLEADDQNDAEGKWTEAFLEKVGKVGVVRIEVIAQPAPPSRGGKPARRQSQLSAPTLTLQDPRNSFVIAIPISAISQPVAQGEFIKALDTLFSTPARSQTQAQREDLEDDDWSAVPTPSTESFPAHNLPNYTPTSSITTSSALLPFYPQTSQPAKPKPLPNLTSLPNPSLLFATTCPQILHLRHERNRSYLTASSNNPLALPDRLLLTCTHPPTLQLIHDYFSKCTRSDTQTRERIPLVKYTLGQSMIDLSGYRGSGGWDNLVMEWFSQMSSRGGAVLGVALVVAFVEGVCGFVPVGRERWGASAGGEGEFWEFRRDLPFA